ncbi:MAG: Rrf2 family transcriptional regulator [Holophaga sp.]|nr:Rrf2 family transcriptional regulator [Holophaga sp.]
MIFSTTTGYALRVLTWMPEDGSYHFAKDLASQLALPAPYLAKILKLLARNGILHSIRGPRGGFRLVRPAHRITLGDVVFALDGQDPGSGCVLGLSDCKRQGKGCPLQAVCREARASQHAILSRVTIRDLQLLERDRRSWRLTVSH